MPFLYSHTVPNPGKSPSSSVCNVPTVEYALWTDCPAVPSFHAPCAGIPPDSSTAQPPLVWRMMKVTT
eukprot:6971061-Ditylum_brightwellii.AAC.1